MRKALQLPHCCSKTADSSAASMTSLGALAILQATQGWHTWADLGQMALGLPHFYSATSDGVPPNDSHTGRARSRCAARRFQAKNVMCTAAHVR